MASLLAYALTSKADVKESLDISSGDTSKDNLIIRKINQATLYIESWCQLAKGVHFASTTYTQEEYDGTGTNQLVLKARPIITLTALQYRDSTENTDSWSDMESEWYFTDDDAAVIDLNIRLTRHWNRYRVTYTAGFSTIPADLAEACVTLAAYYVDNAASGAAVKRKREGQREIEYHAPQTSQDGSTSLIEQLGLDDILARYVNMPLLEDK